MNSSFHRIFSASPLRQTGWSALAGAGLLTVLFLTASWWPAVRFYPQAEQYLALHIALEFFSIAIALMVFAIGWNTHAPDQADNFTLLACAFLSVGLLDFLHTLSYAGMPIFVTPSDVEKGINFWLAARVIAAAALLAVAVRPWQPATQPHARYLWLALALAVTSLAAWAGLYHAGDLPRTFIAGVGLTDFKIGTEYLIVFLHALTVTLLLRKNRPERGINLAWLAAAVWVMGLGELFFTLYTTTTDFFNFAGHIYKAIAYAMVYQAVFVSSVRDPYERLRVAAMRQLERTQFAIDHAGEQVLWIDRHARIQSANLAACRRLGYSGEEIGHLGIADIDPSFQPEKWPQYWETAKRDGTVLIETLQRTKAGETYPIEASINFVTFGGEEVICAFARDITLRKQADALLKKSEESLNEAQHIAHIGNWELDLVSGKLLWSDEIYRIFEIDPEKFGASYEAFLNAIHPDDRDAVNRAYTDSLANQAPYEIDHRLLMSDNRIKYVHERCLSYFDPDGKPLRSVGTVQDVTELRLAEMELRQLNATLEERIHDEVAKNLAQERMLIHQSRLAAMGEMIGNIAHQWRQPIEALALTLTNIKDAYEYQDLTQEYLDAEVAAGQKLIQKMSATIDDFRDFFRPNKKKQRFPALVGVEEAIKLISESYRRHHIDIDLEECDPSVNVMGYPNEFSQVVLNALSNAKEAIVEKKIGGKVHIRIEPQGDTAAISIRDNGGGIPEEVLPKVFEPYFTTKEKGTGIGLYMSKMIIDNMDGGIAIRNVEGGAEVLLALPLANPAICP